MKTTDSLASIQFEVGRPLNFSATREDRAEHGTYIYSTAVDGHNAIRVATVDIANIVGLSDEQEAYMRRRVAQDIVEADMLRAYIEGAYGSYREGRCTKGQFADNVIDAILNGPSDDYRTAG